MISVTAFWLQMKPAENREKLYTVTARLRAKLRCKPAGNRAKLSGCNQNRAVTRKYPHICAHAHEYALCGYMRHLRYTFIHSFNKLLNIKKKEEGRERNRAVTVSEASVTELAIFNKQALCGSPNPNAAAFLQLACVIPPGMTRFPNCCGNSRFISLIFFNKNTVSNFHCCPRVSSFKMALFIVRHRNGFFDCEHGSKFQCDVETSNSKLVNCKEVLMRFDFRASNCSYAFIPTPTDSPFSAPLSGFWLWADIQTRCPKPARARSTTSKRARVPSKAPWAAFGLTPHHPYQPPRKTPHSLSTTGARARCEATWRASENDRAHDRQK